MSKLSSEGDAMISKVSILIVFSKLYYVIYLKHNNKLNIAFNKDKKEKGDDLWVRVCSGNKGR